MPEIQVPVLIVGGGLTGLAAALFLRQHDVDCLLVERNTTTSQLLRSTHVSPRTMELFRTVGIQQAVWDVAEKVVLGKYWSRGDLPPHQLPRAILRAASLDAVAAGDVIVMDEGANSFTAVSPTEPVWCGQDRVEPIMLARARELGADIRFATDMASFSPDEDGVTARIVDRASGEATDVRARYLIGADGAGGAIRTAVGIEREGNGTIGHVLNVLFEAELDTILGGRRFLILYLTNPKAPGMLFKLDDRRWIFGLSCGPEDIVEGKISPEECVDIVRTAVGRPEIDVKVLTTMGWWMAHEVVRTYRNKRVFLAGDACHVLPPTGGFGANAGIQDANNLAWKLAGVLNGWADEALLDTYDAERLPVGKETADQAWMRHMRWAGPAKRGERDERDQTVVTTAYRYTSAAIIGDPYPEALGHDLTIDGKPGMRVPHVWVGLNGNRVSTVDMAGPEFALLAGPDGQDWVDAARDAAAELGIPLRCHTVGAGATLDDPEHGFLDAAGLTRQGALLVRPDGFVGWRNPESGNGEETAVLHGVLSRISAPVSAALR